MRRLLIANRGEIACRIARTAHRLGIDTVGVYSEPDRNALHVDVVDVAVALRGAGPADSYLDAEALVAAAARMGCDAVHPGYGFLAESAGFARRVGEAGLIWVGPTPEQIALLGDKTAAKQTAVAAGVPTSAFVEVGPDGPLGDISFPALIKAAAGGGGRGMRIVRDASELVEALESARREAASAFGDGTLFIEPYIDHARHIEVQIIGDTHGAVIHLGERECSIQRRNQKLVEEAPSPGIDTATRRRLTEAAVALARHVGYVNAGTVEFLVGADGTVTFLEVNTRLQVEHPVTEATTGLDLVELQLRVADGERLPISQSEVAIDGHSIEVRLVAEDPVAGWIPSGGPVRLFDLGDGVRVDAGVQAGVAVSSEYDSLLAKVIAHGPNRSVAVQQLERALRSGWVAGPRTNLATLLAILAEPDFRAGETTTAYLADHPSVVTASALDDSTRVALLVGATMAAEYAGRAADPVTGFAPSGWRNLRTAGQRVVWTLNEADYPVEYLFTAHDAVQVWLGPWPEPQDDGSLAADTRQVLTVRLLARTAGRQVVEVDGRRLAIETRQDGETMHTRCAGGSASWDLRPRFVVHEPDELGSGPISPLPGTVIAVYAEPGQQVVEGDLLMVVEAMKMEHKITAAGAATVGEVRFREGDRVDAGDLLVELHHDDGNA